MYAVCYDLSGAKPDTMVDRLAADWKRLVDEKKVTADDRYLRHNGKPVVFVWGFYSDRFGPVVANRVVDIFKADGPYAATLVGGCQWYWRTEKDAEWVKAFRRFDVISPWNVGNVMPRKGASKYMPPPAPGKTILRRGPQRAGMPPICRSIYPGFGWTNLKGAGAAGAKTRPRDWGAMFYWHQFATAADLGVDMAYVAMFDEVDEGTAIFKVSNAPPKEATFATYDGLPADWYLRLTGEGTKLIRGERKAGAGLPIGK